MLYRIGSRNKFVIIFKDTKYSNISVSCIFNETGAIQKICEIDIANGENCVGSLKGSKRSAVNYGDTVTIYLGGLFNEGDVHKMFCCNITASDGNQEVVVQDIISVENFAVPITVHAIAITTVILNIIITMTISYSYF